MTEVVCGSRDGDGESDVVKPGVTTDPGSGVWSGDCSDVSITDPGGLVDRLAELLSNGTVAKGMLVVDTVKAVVSPDTLLPALDPSLRVVEDTGRGLSIGCTELLRVDASKVDCKGSDNAGMVLED